ncbi:hypothetical protein ACS0TY_008872 [Phlomoides rotata]
MDVVYKELDEAKAEINELRKQYRVKVELAESLKRAHNDQLSKNKEASCKLEKLGHELNEKDDEIFTVKGMYEELKSSLTEKESIIRHLTSAHDKLRLDCSEKLCKFEEETKALSLALDDANAKNLDQEQQICALKQEIEGVKGALNFSQKKCSQNESKGYKNSEVREDFIFKVEEEKKKFEDQLKWKKEQFVHLEEAHENLRKQFRMRENEWKKERGELLDGISSLESNLESQTRISQDLQRRLEMCNGALAHAESKRKLLEAQLLESRTSLDNVSSEYDEAKLNFESLAAKRDQEIANLRSSLGTKEILYKEMEYQFRKAEQEKQELLISLKEHQEAQIRRSSFSSASKLQNKLKSLEQVHKGCSTNLKVKESEWCSQMEKLSEELNICKSELKSRETSLSELNRELEACDSLKLELELLNQETSLFLLVLKSEFSEAKLRLADNHSCMNLKNIQVEGNMYELVDQLEKKKAALSNVQKDLEEEREKVAILSKKVQVLEGLQLPLQKEVERLKEMLEESTSSQLQSKEQVLLIQSDLEKVNDALRRANEELYEKFCEANEIEFELQIWQSMAQHLEANLKQNYQLRKEVEASLLAQMDVELSLKQEKESLGHQLEEKEERLDGLQQQLVDSSIRAEETESSSQVDEEKGRLHETESLHQLVEEKDQRIYDLQQLVASLEHEFESSTTSFSSKLSRMQREINILRESWEKIKADDILKEMELQEKNTMLIELEDDIGILLQRIDQQEETLLDSEKQMQEIQAALQKKELELEAKISTSEKTIKKLTNNGMFLSSENTNLLNTMGLLSEKMEKLTFEDNQLMESLKKIVHAVEVSRAHLDDEQENTNTSPSPSTLLKKFEATHDERSPLRAINY